MKGTTTQDSTSDTTTTTFEQFMLSSKSKKNKNNDNENNDSNQDSSHPHRTKKKSPNLKLLKSITPQFNSFKNNFTKILQNGYLFHASEGNRIVAALGELQNRLEETDLHYLKLAEAEIDDAEPAYELDVALRPPSILSHLTIEDVRDVVNYDLTLRERYFSLIRGVVGSLNEAVESLGRILEEGTNLHFEVLEILDEIAPVDIDDESWSEEEDTLTRKLRLNADYIDNVLLPFFRHLGLEVYRKQRLIKFTLDAADAFGGTEGGSKTASEAESRAIETLAKNWSDKCDSSHLKIYDYDALVAFKHAKVPDE